MKRVSPKKYPITIPNGQNRENRIINLINVLISVFDFFKEIPKPKATDNLFKNTANATNETVFQVV